MCCWHVRCNVLVLQIESKRVWMPSAFAAQRGKTSAETQKGWPWTDYNEATESPRMPLFTGHVNYTRKLRCTLRGELPQGF
jgi:hypothetical protein